MRAPLALGAVALATFALADNLPKPEGPSLRRLYSYPLIHGRSPAGAALAPNGKTIVFGWNQKGERRRDVWVMDYPSGNKRQILAADSISRFPRQDDSRTELQKTEELLYDDGIGSYQWAPGSDEIMFGYRGRTWLMKPNGDALRPLFDSSEQVSLPQYSPDGKYIGFIRGANLFRVERATGAIKQLTFLSKPNTAIDGYVFSPSGDSVAVSWGDSSKMGRHVMMDFSKERAEVVPITRMWNGERSVNSQIGVVSSDGGIIKFVKNIPSYLWVTSMSWAPDGSRFAFGWISEDFQKYAITTVRKDGEGKIDAYNETAPKNYIPDFREVQWTRDSSRILFTTDIIDGKFVNRSLRKVDVYGKNLESVYAESHDIAGFTRPKNSDRLFIVSQSRSALTSEIVIQEADGKRESKVVLENGMATPVGFDDCQPPMVSDDGKLVATLASQRELNPEIYGVVPQVKRLTESQLPEYKDYKWANHERVSFQSEDGRTIGALLITKPGLDKTKKHPAIISNMYANSAKQTWAGYINNYLAMELGYVVIQVDFRASWGYGGEFNSGYAKSLGVVDTREAVACKKYLVGLGYVNPDRCGVWGWSYGGYLTCMIMLTAPGEFDTGVAVASVTDWESYNEWYTRRRLGLPADNKELYKQTSPVHHAKGLQGNLMLVHGMLDDNVLYQDTVRLMENLIIEGKQFDTFAYPRGDHGMWRVHESPHVWELIVGELYQKLSRP